jgi:hypothetical protein
MNTESTFDFVTRLDENNPWLMEMIKNHDEKTYEMLTKVKANIFMLQFFDEKALVEKLSEKYKEVLVKAYAYFLDLNKMEK